MIMEIQEFVILITCTLGRCNEILSFYDHLCDREMLM